MVWEIHNLGCTPAKDVMVQLWVNGQLEESAMISEVPPVRDYRIGASTVTFQYRGLTDKLSVVVDPDDRIDEITERNNRPRVIR